MKMVDNKPIEGVRRPLVSNARAKKMAIKGREEHLSVLRAVTITERVKSIVTLLAYQLWSRYLNRRTNSRTREHEPVPPWETEMADLEYAILCDLLSITEPAP